MIYKTYANMSHVLNRCERWFFIPTEYDQHTSSFTVLQDRVSRVIFGHKRGRTEVTTGWRKLLRERLHYFCYSPKQSVFYDRGMKEEEMDGACSVYMAGNAT
jgi:hypothetical protein